jgi:hypothetical protein
VRNRARGKIAILYQNDDYGKDCVKGLKHRAQRELSSRETHEQHERAAPLARSAYFVTIFAERREAVARAHVKRASSEFNSETRRRS